MIIPVAVAQAGSVPFDAAGTVEKAVSWIREAKKAGAKLIVFPEAFIGTYTRGASFGAPVGMRTPEGREAFLRYFNNSIEVPGPESEIIGKAARENGVYVVMGVLERTVTGTLFCTILFWDDAGRLMGKRRKLIPIGGERLVWGSGDGSTLPVFATPLGRMGAVTCWENYMPMLRMHMYNQGIQLYCAPTADDKENWISTMRHISIEGRCFVLGACQHIRRGAYPADYECLLGDDPDLIVSRGGSAIIDPFGRTLTGPDFSSESLLVAELDLEEIVRAKFDLDIAGHCARPDIFELHVNTAPMSAVREIARTDGKN